MIAEALHYGAVLPAAGAVLCRTRLPRGTALIATAFAVSWLGDTLAWATGGAWYTSHLWLPVQFGLVLWAVTERGADRVLPLALILAATLVSMAVFAPGPDVVITLTGSALVLVTAMRSRHPLALPVLIYFGVGSVCYLMMVSHYVTGTAMGGGFDSWWWAYQAARVMAWAAFLWILWGGGRRAC